MNTTILLVSFWIMAACCIAIAIVNRILILSSRRVTRQAAALAEEYSRYKIEEVMSRQSEALIEERTDTLVPCFIIYRKGIIEKFEILRVCYEPSDPDDRQYKQIHAQEVADKINEQP